MDVPKKLEELGKAMVFGTVKFTNAKTDLAKAIISGQQDIADMITKLSALTGSNNAFYCTFANSYINLFMSVYNRVDTAYKKVLSEGALSKEDFAALNVEQIGITPNAVGYIPWYFWTEDHGINSFYNTVDVNLCPVLAYGEKSYTRFIFPDKFYYHATGGGEDYKHLYLHVPFGSLPSLYTPYWVEGLNAYGPFSYEGESGLFYSQFVDAIHFAIPEVSFVLKNNYSTVWFELEDPETMRPLLTNKLSKFGDTVVAQAPVSFSEAFRTNFRQDVLYANLTDRYGSHHPECYVIYSDVLVEEKSDSLAALVSNSTDTSGIYSGFATAGISTTSQGMENRPLVFDTDITSSSFGRYYLRLKNFKLNSVELGSYHTLHNLGMYLNFPDLVTYDFKKFFDGKFGEDLTVSNIERQTHKYSRKQRDENSAEEIFVWLRSKTCDRPSITDITSKISSFDVLVQLADLYSVRYLVAKVLLGHFHRINKK